MLMILPIDPLSPGDNEENVVMDNQYTVQRTFVKVSR